TAEEVDYATGNEDHADGEQDAQADLRIDRAGSPTGERLDDQLEDDGTGHRTERRAGAAEDGHQDHLHVVGNGEDEFLVDEAGPLREDATGDAAQRRSDA